MDYLFAGILGLMVGSYITMLIYRIPESHPVVRRKPYCTYCSNKIAFCDLIPLISYIFLKGKCRSCGRVISLRYPLVEIITATIFIIVFNKYGLGFEFFALTYLMTILIAITFIDIDHRIIPDKLIFAAIIGGTALFVYNIYKPVEIYGTSKWWEPLAGIIPGSFFLLAIFITGTLIYGNDEAMGMGDVKLYVPIGLFLGWRLCIVSLTISVVSAGVASVILILTGLKKRKDTIPFGPFIVLGTFATLIWGWDIFNWYLGV